MLTFKEFLLTEGSELEVKKSGEEIGKTQTKPGRKVILNLYMTKKEFEKYKNLDVEFQGGSGKWKDGKLKDILKQFDDVEYDSAEKQNKQARDAENHRFDVVRKSAGYHRQRAKTIRRDNMRVVK